jgi:hypothetical protein
MSWKLLRKELLEPGLLDRGREAQDARSPPRASSDLGDLGRDQERRLAGWRSPGPGAPAAVDEVAAQRPRVEPARELVGEAGQHALAHLGARPRPGAAPRCPGPRPRAISMKLLEERPDLSGRLRVDPEAPAGVEGVAAAVRVPPGAHQQEESRSRASSPKSTSSRASSTSRDTPRSRKVAALRERGHQGHRAHAAPLLRLEEHAGVAGVDGKAQHPPAHLGDQGAPGAPPGRPGPPAAFSARSSAADPASRASRSGHVDDARALSVSTTSERSRRFTSGSSCAGRCACSRSVQSRTHNSRAPCAPPGPPAGRRSPPRSSPRGAC